MNALLHYERPAKRPEFRSTTNRQSRLCHPGKSPHFHPVAAFLRCSPHRSPRPTNFDPPRQLNQGSEYRCGTFPAAFPGRGMGYRTCAEQAPPHFEMFPDSPSGLRLLPRVNVVSDRWIEAHQPPSPPRVLVFPPTSLPSWKLHRVQSQRIESNFRRDF